MRNSELLTSFSSEWINFSNYELKETDKGEVYICPTKDATINIYKAFNVMNEMLPEILNIGRLIGEEASKKVDDSARINALILVFVRKYGLLGAMNYFPYNEDFLNQNKVYLPDENPISPKAVLSANDYIRLFLPFATEDDFEINIQKGTTLINYKQEVPITMFIKRDMRFDIAFSKFYCEKLEWFKNYASQIYAYFYFINRYYETDDIDLKAIHQKAVSAFIAKGMKFGLTLFETPKIEWDFNSLIATIDTIFGFMVSGDDCPIRACKHDSVVFYAKNPKAAFCSTACRNQYNVYKTRAKKDELENSADQVFVFVFLCAIIFIVEMLVEELRHSVGAMLNLYNEGYSLYAKNFFNGDVINIYFDTFVLQRQ